MGAKKKKISLLTKKQEKQLKQMATDLIDVASHVVSEYEDIELADFGLNDISSSLNDLIQIHGDSPFLEEVFDGYVKDINTVYKDIEFCWETVNKYYSYESIKKNILELI